MRGKLTRVNWRHLIYTAATFATLLLAAGARWKPSGGGGGGGGG